MAQFLDCTELINGPKAIGISIWILPNDEFEVFSITLLNSRKKLTVNDSKHFYSIGELAKNLSCKLPVYLSIDGKGIIHKKIESKYDGSVIDAILPNAPIRDFVIQECNPDTETRFISIIRKDKLDGFVNEINNAGFVILRIFLGPFSTLSIVNSLESNSELHIPYYDLKIVNNQIKSFQKGLNHLPEFNIELGSELLNSKYIVPFSNGIHHFIENSDISLDYSELGNQRDIFHFKKLIRIYEWGIIVFLFICLLVNFIGYSYYSERNRNLLTNVGSNIEILENIDKLKRLISAKEEFLESNSLKNSLLFAYYSDRLAKEVPPGITLEKLTLFPLQKESAKKEAYNFLNGRIIVNGNSYGSNNLDLWINSLKKLKWIERIVIKNYNDNGSETAFFELEIELIEL